jgi:predicted transcriptional regulator
MASRLSVQFDDRLSKILEDIANEKKTSKTDILRRAIATYSALEKEITSDGIILVQKDGQVVKQLVIP